MRCPSFQPILSVITLVVATSSVQAKGGLGEIFGALIRRSAGQALGKAMATPESVESALRKMTEEVNKRMPMTVDKETRLDNVLTGPGPRYTYNYTLVSYKSAEVDRAYLTKHLNGPLRAGVCSNPDLQVFFKHGVTIGYSYRASDGGFVGRIDIAPKDCGIVG